MLFFIYNILFLFYSYNFLCGKEASKFNTKKRLITGVIILRLEESSMQKPHRHLLPRTNVESRPSSILLCLCFLDRQKSVSFRVENVWLAQKVLARFPQSSRFVLCIKKLHVFSLKQRILIVIDLKNRAFHGPQQATTFFKANCILALDILGS